MGYAYDELIAQAVLWKNPGITREEFVELLDRTHSSYVMKYEPEQAWDYYNPDLEDPLYHQGLYGLALLLGLEYTKKYREFKMPANPTIDEHGVRIMPPSFFLREKKERNGSRHRFEVLIHKKNIVGEPKRIAALSSDKLSVGEIWLEDMINKTGVITKIFDEKYLEDKDYFPHEQWHYDMEIKPFVAEHDTKLYETKDDFWKAWPQFHPDNIYDWAKAGGAFSAGSIWGGNNFLWQRKEKKYYLDERTFEQIPLSIRSGLLGYTDLVLTAGALKHNAWKILAYKGLDYFQDFLRDFPDVKEQYERAVWDAYTSLYAKSRGMNVFEILRARIHGF